MQIPGWRGLLAGVVVCTVGGGVTSCGVQNAHHAAKPTPTPTPKNAALITVGNRAGQTMQGWGTAVTGDPVHWPQLGVGLTGPQVAAIDQAVFRDGRINLVRVFGPGPGDHTGGVVPWTRSDPRLKFMARTRAMNVQFMFTGGGAPAAMRVGGAPHGALAVGQGTLYADYLSQNLQVAKQAGTPFTWAAAGNEPDVGGADWLAMSPAQAAHVYRRLDRDIAGAGLKTKLVLGDNSGWGIAAGYAQLESAVTNPIAHPAIMAAHAYRGTHLKTINILTGFAAKQRLAVWMTEWTPGCPRGNCPVNDTMRYALRWAREINHDINAGAQAWFLFQAVANSTHGPDGALIVRDVRSGQLALTRRYYVFRQFTDAAPPGARRFDVRSANGSLGTLAFRRGKITTLVVTNETSSSAPVKVSLGKASGVVAVRQTSSTERFLPLSSVRYSGAPLPAVLPPLSVTTFYLHAR